MRIIYCRQSKLRQQAVYIFVLCWNIVYGFIDRTSRPRTNFNVRTYQHYSLKSSSSSSSFQEKTEDDPTIQWDLFTKHHAKGSWKGIWTTYDYIGDVIDETVASVDLNLIEQKENGKMVIDHAHTIVVGAKRSDCRTCFDSMELKTLPVAQYTPENILQKSRLAGVSMVNGPSILRSGAMATELILRYGDGRVRVTFNHAPVWEKDVEPGSCPPQGLKLFRVMLSREALRTTAPTAETEAQDPPSSGNPIFYRPVPPFNWHKKWSGTSWTWGEQTGNRGWSIDELDETDSWQGITPVDCWNLRLPGGIHLQTPRVIADAAVGIYRLAWLPDDETLLRVEAGVSALQPMHLEDDEMVGFEPPTLTSLRCDMLKKTGELENVDRPFRNEVADKNEEKELEPPALKSVENSYEKQSKTKKVASSKEDSESDSLRDTLSL